MNVVQTNAKIESKSHDEDLAAYLDKLLRQKPKPPQPVQPPAVQERQRSALSTESHEGPSSNGRPLRPWSVEHMSRPAAEKRTQWSKAPAAKRAKPRSPRRIRTKPHNGRQKPKGTRQVVMTALIPVLAVTLLVLARRPMSGPAAAKAETFEAAPAQAGEVKIDWEIPPVYEMTGHDPMSFASSPQVPEQEPSVTQTQVQVYETLEVKGVLYSEDRPAAIVGTRLVHEGENIAGATVVAIERDGVLFERNGQKWTQTVSLPSIAPGQEMKQSPEDGS